MRKQLEKYGKLRLVGGSLCALSLVLWIIAIFIDANMADMALKTIGVLSFIVGGMILSIKSEEHQLVKSLLVFIIALIIMTWLYPLGYFQGTEFVGNEFQRVGIADIGYVVYYAINFVIDKLILLFVTAGFYGVLSNVTGYQKLIVGIAKKLKKHTLVSTLVICAFIYILTSLLTQTFMVIIFIPFFVSILTKMNIDKLTVFAATFGSALASVIGITYGSDALSSFNNYTKLTISTGLGYRFIIAAVVLIVYCFFLLIRMKKINKNSKNTDLVIEDPFEVEETKSKKSTIPVIVILSLLAIIVILGYVDWKTYFNITIFDSFHTWLTSLAIKDFKIFSYILGAKASAFGLFNYVFLLSGGLIIFAALIAFLDKVKLNDFISNFYDGLRKMLKPALYLIGVFMLFGICYLVPVVPTIVKWLFGFTKTFNPFITTIVALISNAFQVDLGYTAYTIGGYLTSTYAENIDIISTIFVSINGLVQLILPTSALLVVGLSLMKVDYKSWFKYIWLFVIGILVILLVLFTVLTYI